MATDAPCIGVDLGGTNMQIGVVDAAGTVLGRTHALTEPERGQQPVIDRLAETITNVCRSQSIDVGSLAAIGVGTRGIIDPHRGVMVYDSFFGWTNFAIAEALTARLGVPTFIDNDVNVAAWGEYRHGAGRGATCLLGAWVGTGIGGGFIFDGKLHYGAWFTAGEVGRMIAEPSGPPGMRDLEQVCSRTSVSDRLASLIEWGRPSVIPSLLRDEDGATGEITSRILGRAYAERDALTMEVVDDAADRLGVMLGSIVTMLSIDRIVLGGGLTEGIGTAFVDRVTAACRRVAYPAACQQVEVVLSALRDDAGVIGAADLARTRAASKG